ncbi:glycosyltransferase [Leucobacter sp. OH1287]|uniref:glycosyltransferase n=1 Tax=Leucobacter sp. OH1287 TaxID=2491049 RepID=UPI000F5D6CD1|nr:glycosyltransferase [Leucobacter sp. OH1287]RRD61584.1 glycosyltransferase [Leucobacter sp. OH1287]
MHILIFSDQHVESLGGAQTSILLQRKYLQRAGHLVTVCQPRSFKPGVVNRSRQGVGSDAAHAGDNVQAAARGGSALAASSAVTELNTPAIPVTPDREYSLTLPTGLVQRWLDRHTEKLPPIDLVLVQADFAQALIGYRFARRHRLPVVHTTHTNIGESFRSNTGRIAPLLLRGFLLLQRHRLGGRRSRLKDPEFAIYDEYARRAAAVVTPSLHFQELLRKAGVSTGYAAAEFVHAITGVDDDLVDPVAAAGGAADATVPAGAAVRRDPTRIVWSGRMSPEKRLLPFIEALRLLATGGAEFNAEIYGEGAEKDAAITAVKAAGLDDRVRFCGRVSYPEMLAAQRHSGVLAQTSIGFETQGMTVYESLTLGTVVAVSDPNIYAEVASAADTADFLVAVADRTPQSLARALRQALQLARAASIGGGEAGAAGEGGSAPAPHRQFLQSTQTAKLLDVYSRVLRVTGRR